LFMAEQYIAPAVRDSQAAINTVNFTWMLERVLKLSVPNLYVWLVLFSVMFHFWLNILAELLRFGDRRFYLDWWNACSLGYYWRTWNLPVHNWLVRHVYAPIRASGGSKAYASFIVFLLSAIAHEVMIAVPCHMPSVYAFLGMIAQFPLVMISEQYKQGSIVGNLFFWFSFCIFGQPISVLLYYFQYTRWHPQ